MRGVCFVYQGQEMGMLNSCHGSIEEFDDVESINKYAELCQTMTPQQAMERINFGGRDNARRPMCWNADGSGFTTGKPWQPFHSLQDSINLEADMASEKSVHHFYRDLLHLRSDHQALTVGSFEALDTDGTYAAFRRKTGEEQITVVVNFEMAQDIPGINAGKLLLSNYGTNEKHDDHFRPYEVAVFQN